MQKINKKTIALCIAVLGSAIVLLANLGYHVEPPFPLSIQVNANRTIDSNSENGVFEDGVGGAVIDSGLTRIIFLDSEKRANEIRPITETSDSIVYYRDIKIKDGLLYVLSYEKYQDNGYMKNQKVCTYDFFGNKQQTIYEENYEQEEEKFFYPKILWIDKEGEDLYVVRSDKKAKEVKVIDLLANEHPTILSFKPNIDDEICSSDYNKASNTVGIITAINDTYIYKGDQLITKTKALGENISIQDDGSYKFIASQNAKLITINSVNFSPLLIFRTLLFWLCLIFLMVFIIVAIVKNAKKLKRALSIMLIIACGLGLSIFYSCNMGYASVENYINVLNVSSLNANTMVNEQKGLITQGKQNYKKIKNTFTELKENNLNCGFNIDYTLISHKDNDYKQGSIIFSTTDNKRVDSHISVYDTSGYHGIKGNLQEQNYEVFLYSDYANSYLVSQYIIRDANGVAIASIYTTLDVFLTGSYLLTSIAKTFVNLLIVIISIALLVSELKGLATSMKLKKKYAIKKIKHPEIAFSRILSFLTTFVTSFDSALIILITKDILSTNSFENSTFLLGVPPMAMSIGMTLGKPVFNTLSKHINIKSIMILLSILLGISYVGCFYFVATSMFYGYTLAILLSGIFTGAFTGIKFYLPLLSPNDEVRFEINKNNALTGISGNVLSIALAGIVAGTMSSQFIYIMALAPTLVFALLGIFAFPKNTKYYKKPAEKTKTSIIETIKFIITPAFLSFAFFMLMTDTLATGYKSFMFPLFTSDAGFSKSEISNFVVIANFLAFLINKNSKKIIEKIDFLPISILCTVATGLAFISFIINNSILWATLVIAIIMVFAKLSGMCNGMLWPRLCKKKNFSEQTCNKAIIYFNDFTYMIRSMILTSLLLIGITNACFWMGIYMIVGAVIFALIAKKSGFSKGKSKVLPKVRSKVLTKGEV